MEPTGLIEWHKKYESGIEAIDRDHKNIINILNDIYLSVENQETKEKLPELIKTFDLYTDGHFKLEEDYAEKYNFPKSILLKESHVFFKTIYKPLKDCYCGENKSPAPELQTILHLHSVMGKWLEHHIPGIDMELCKFLKDKIK